MRKSRLGGWVRCPAPTARPPDQKLWQWRQGTQLLGTHSHTNDNLDQLLLDLGGITEECRQLGRRLRQNLEPHGPRLECHTPAAF